MRLFGAYGDGQHILVRNGGKMFGYVVLALLFLWGVLMIAKPDLLWSIEHTGQMDRQRPTEKYISSMRVIGSVCMVLAVALFVMFLR